MSAAGIVPREKPAQPLSSGDVDQLRTLLAKGAFKGRRVVLTVPGDQLLTGILELPPRSSGAPLDQMARNELSRMHRCGSDSFEMACWDLPAPVRAGGATYVMAAGFRHNQAEELMETVEGGGFDVCALDIRASAVARACRPLLAGAVGISAILDLRWGQGDLVFLHHGAVVYERTLAKCGVGVIVDSLGREMKLHRDKAEDIVRQAGLSTQYPGVSQGSLEVTNQLVGDYCRSLVEEMRIPLSYLTNQYPDAAPETLLLVGGGSVIPGVEELLDSLLDFRVRIARPGDIVQCSSDIDSQFGPSLAAATGMGQFSERQK